MGYRLVKWEDCNDFAFFADFAENNDFAGYVQNFVKNWSFWDSPISEAERSTSIYPASWLVSRQQTFIL